MNETTTNEIYKILDGPCTAASMSFDLTMAFDCIPHNMLLAKQEAYGVAGVNLRWFESYLTNRKQKTEIFNSSVTDWGTVLDGIPQGSVLVPILFNVYINDLPLSVNAEIIQFADDTSAILKANNKGDQSNLIKTVSSEMADWCKINGLVLNDAKTNVILDKSRCFPHDLPFTCGIQTDTASKFLRVYVDQNFDWKSHVLYRSRKLSCLLIRDDYGV